MKSHVTRLCGVGTGRPKEECGDMTTSADTGTRTFEAAWNEWHGDRERSYADPLGLVSLTGLYWLTEEFAAIADLPGRWRADTDAVYVEGIDGNRTARTDRGRTRIARRGC